MPDQPIRYWQSMTTLEARDIARRDPVVVLPIAAIEQHGPHLPLSTDLDIGMGILATAFRHLPDDFPAWVLPPQAVGTSGEHTRFAGTVSLASELLVEVIREHGVGLGPLWGKAPGREQQPRRQPVRGGRSWAHASGRARDAGRESQLLPVPTP